MNRVRQSAADRRTAEVMVKVSRLRAVKEETLLKVETKESTKTQQMVCHFTWSPICSSYASKIR